MPHQVPKSEPRLSPADVDGPLQAIKDSRNGDGINLIGVGGSKVEQGGKIAFLVKDGRDLDDLLTAIDAYKPVVFGEPDHQHLDYVDHVPGGLLDAVRRGRVHHANGSVLDFIVGVEPITFYRFTDGPSAGFLIRYPPEGKAGHIPVTPDKIETPVDTAQDAEVAADGVAFEEIKRLPISIAYHVPPERDGEGRRV